MKRFVKQLRGQGICYRDSITKMHGRLSVNPREIRDRLVEIARRALDAETSVSDRRLVVQRLGEIRLMANEVLIALAD